MKRMVGAVALLLTATSAAFAGRNFQVPEMDGAFALAAAAVVMGVGAVVYETYFRR